MPFCQREHALIVMHWSYWRAAYAQNARQCLDLEALGKLYLKNRIEHSNFALYFADAGAYFRYFCVEHQSSRALMVQVTDKPFQDHCVFAELQQYMNFYERLAMSVFSFATRGTTAICNIDTYVYSSMQGTVESMRTILLGGRINDAYALLRKYHDSAIINIYSNLYLHDNFSIENFIVEKIYNWLQGKEKLPEYRVMSKYIKDSGRSNRSLMCFLLMTDINVFAIDATTIRTTTSIAMRC